MTVEEWLDVLSQLGSSLQGDGPLIKPPLEQLAAYYSHLADLAKGYEKNAAKLEDSLRHVYGWRDEVVELEKMLA